MFRVGADQARGHSHQHAFSHFNALEREGLTLLSRRNLLKAGLMGIAGLSVPGLLRQRARAAAEGKSVREAKSVILLWMAGGPSHIDTWDPKPDRPLQNRGPFSAISSKLPGTFLCERLPKQAAMLDKFTVIRSVDARNGNHAANAVFQTGNLDAEPLVNPKAPLIPAIGSIVAKHHGPNHPALPAYATFTKSQTHVARAGCLGKQYDPFIADQAAKLPIYTEVGLDTGQTTRADLFRLPQAITVERIHDRRSLLRSFDNVRREIDSSGSMAAMDRYGQEAVDMVVGARAREAFDLAREPEKVRDRYGKHLWCQQALLARRMIEAGVAFVTLDLSYEPTAGTWDTHGDNILLFGGIQKGLGALLPIFDHLITTLVSDLDQRGLLDNVLVIALGEFGRTPNLNSDAGRDHWPVCMSMVLAGGGFQRGQIIGATEKDGGNIKERPVTPGDIAATVYQHMGVPLDATYVDTSGRPHFVVENGKPIGELVSRHS
jgi:hypothetical protein